MTLQEAKLTAVLGIRAPIGDVAEALGVLYDEVRRYETQHMEAIGASGEKSPFPPSKPWRPGDGA